MGESGGVAESNKRRLLFILHLLPSSASKGGVFTDCGMQILFIIFSSFMITRAQDSLGTVVFESMPPVSCLTKTFWENVNFFKAISENCDLRQWIHCLSLINCGHFPFSTGMRCTLKNFYCLQLW